jgi:hypothetical protein
MKSIIKVPNSSDYWTDFEGDLSVYYHFKWTEISMGDFLINEKSIVKEFISLATKYRIAIPMQNLESDSLVNSLYDLYTFNNKLLYPTELFTNLSESAPSKIISVDPLLKLEDYERKVLSHGSVPFRIELIKKTSVIKILCYIDNDVFNLVLNNKKCNSFEFPIDNSELAYLNTPRLNSFLRDLKKLCFNFGATDFEFENLGLIDFSEDGVLFNKEIIYYEDICEMLSASHKIVK